VNRRLCELMLRRLGYEPESAVDGQEALERQLELDPDLIQMDVQMPPAASVPPPVVRSAPGSWRSPLSLPRKIRRQRCRRA
jgi:CheY-like chemotaxis protein